MPRNISTNGGIALSQLPLAAAPGSPAAFRLHHHAISMMSGAMRALRTSLTTVATSRATKE